MDIAVRPNRGPITPLITIVGRAHIVDAPNVTGIFTLPETNSEFAPEFSGGWKLEYFLVSFWGWFYFQVRNS